MCAPGAAISGLANPSWVTPALDQSASASSRAVRRALVVDRADGERERVVAGGVGGRVRGGAAVAGGGDDEDAVEVGRLDRGVERVGPVGLGDRRRQREVDDADVELVLVVDGELQAVDRVEDRPAALVVGRLDRDQVRARGDADVLAPGRVADVAAAAVAGDDARDVRAVAVGVRGRLGVRVRHHRGDDARLPVLRRRSPGRAPSMPVSITATPTPSPVAVAQLCGASTEDGYAVSSRERIEVAGRPDARHPRRKCPRVDADARDPRVARPAASARSATAARRRR